MIPSTPKIVLVTGATGTTGSALLRLLQAKGVAVRAMLRRQGNVSRLGSATVTPVVADFDNAGSLRAALSGVHSAYLVTPSSPEAEAQQVRFAEIVAVPPEAFAAALRDVGVPPWQADGLVEDYAHYGRGEAAEVTPTVRDLTGEGPRDIAGFARDYARAFGSG